MANPSKTTGVMEKLCLHFHRNTVRGRASSPKTVSPASRSSAVGTRSTNKEPVVSTWSSGGRERYNSLLIAGRKRFPVSSIVLVKMTLSPETIFVGRTGLGSL